MPEGNALHRSARVLNRVLRGRSVTRFESVYPQLTRVDEDAQVRGRTVEEVSAAGKHLLMRFSGGLVLRSHQRMNGSWHLYRHAEPWRRGKVRARIILETAEYVVVGFDVPDATFHEERPVAQSPVGSLGPDLLSDSFDAAEAHRRLRALGPWAVGEALLDPRAMAGVGNVYKSEILFVGRVNPFARVAELTEAQLAHLVATARVLLAREAEDTRSERSTTRSADPRARLFVYRRGGRPCRRCGTAIAFRRQGVQARPTYFCPTCQR